MDKKISVKTPVLNHCNKTITITAKFSRAAANPFSDEARELMRLREMFSDYEMIIRTCHKPRRTQKTQNIKKFVSYDMIEKYICLLKDRDALLRQFENVKEFASCHRHSASIVFKWFNECFPDYRKAPRFDKDGKLIAAVKIISVEELMKKPRAGEGNDAQEQAG